MLLDPHDLNDPVGRVFEAIASLVGIFLIAVGLDLGLEIAQFCLNWIAGEERIAA